MSHIISILAFEEGYKERAYNDTRGYPTIGCGIVIGPQNAPLANYAFNLPREVGDIWMQKIMDAKVEEIKKTSCLQAALNQCNEARRDMLYSMAYQLGVTGLSAFNEMLSLLAQSKFSEAAAAMQNSRWAKQTPERAARHAQVIRSGTYESYQEVI